ncbi:hypothetical protein LAY57_34235 [Argonema antarcticum A004/B2]|nr:hypothetical protein [Argonema antarcticum A004/B2]
MRVAANNILTVMLPKRKDYTLLSYLSYFLQLTKIKLAGFWMIRFTYQKLFLFQSASPTPIWQGVSALVLSGE